jgi:acid stress chaperone HdeB
MKLIFAIGLVAAMAAIATPAAADKLDFSKMTCGEFLKMSKDNIGLTMVWLEGFYTGQDADPVLDTDKMTADGASLGTYCATNPDTGFMDAAATVVKVQE